VLLDSIRKEAEYFGLPELAEECVPNNVIMPDKVIRSFTSNAEQRELPVDYPVNFTTPLLKALGSLWSQFLVKGEIDIHQLGYIMLHEIYQSCTFHSPNVAELIRVAVPLATGHAYGTVLAIPAHYLTLSILNPLEQQITQSAQNLFPNTSIKMRAAMLIVFQEGGPYDLQHENDGRVGTALATLNTTCAGGVLQITHGDSTEAVTGPTSWVAMHVDCNCTITSVASGARVVLAYAIHAVVEPVGGGEDKCEAEPTAKRTKTGNKVGEDDSDREAFSRGYEVFWNQQEGCKNAPVFNKPHTRGADSEAIYAALNQELVKYSSVVICLQHMYPPCLVLPGFLKSTDAVLHNLLREHYDLQVVYCLVHCQEVCYSRQYRSKVRAVLCPGYEPMVDGVAAAKPTKLVIPAPLNPNSVMDYTPYLTTRQLDEGEAAFVVTGLRVRAKG
jgi:hypothetical protein